MNVNDIFQMAAQIIISVLCIIGILVFANYIAIYIFENYIYENRSPANKQINRRNMKRCNAACLVLNVDEIGDKLEYYIRKIQNDIAGNKYIYISKIILYSESFAERYSGDSEISELEPESESKLKQNNLSEEILRICKILTSEYSNVVFVKGGGSFLFSDDGDV